MVLLSDFHSQRSNFGLPPRGPLMQDKLRESPQNFKRGEEKCLSKRKRERETEREVREGAPPYVSPDQSSSARSVSEEAQKTGPNAHPIDGKKPHKI